MRKTCLDQVYELAKQDERVVFVGSDLGVGVLKEFGDEMPDRFFMEGVSEQSIVGMAAGLALEGRIVYVNTIATFLTRRCFEQVVLDLGLHHANVRLIGNGGGLVYAPLGPTHLAIDDISIMRSVPNMSVVAPCDAEEMKRLMPQTVEHEGPLYIRLAKGYDPVVSSAEHPFRLGEAIELRVGNDVLIVTTGITLRLGLEAADELASQGVEASVLHMHTVKPLDRRALLERASATRAIVTIEEHTLPGGLGSAVAETLADANLDRPLRLRRIGIPDAFADRYGSQSELMSYYGITKEGIVEAATRLLEQEIVG
jgi:transketolase